MNQFLRVFCAVELPAEVRERVATHIVRLRESFPRARVSWERAEKLHLTLKFFGEIETQRIESLNRAIERAASSIKPFTVSIEGAGAFPLHGQPRVLWLGVSDATGRLTRLHERLEEECAAENFARESKPFHAHLTIARIRAPHDARALTAFHRASEFASAAFTVSESVLMQSDLRSSGSLYAKLASHVFTSD